MAWEKKGKWEIGRGAIELWVEDFCSVPRGGVENKQTKKTKQKENTKYAVEDR